MESTRQKKISRLLQKEISEIIQKEGSALFLGKMITVTVVRVSADLSVAKVYVSIFPYKESDIKTINAHTREVRFHLGKRIKNHMRKVPELVFYYDDSFDYSSNIDYLLNQ